MNNIQNTNYENSKAANTSSVRSNLLGEKDAATYLCMSVSSLQKARRTGLLGKKPAPKFYKIGRSIRYPLEQLDAYLDSLELLQRIYWTD